MSKPCRSASAPSHCLVQPPTASRLGPSTREEPGGRDPRLICGVHLVCRACLNFSPRLKEEGAGAGAWGVGGCGVSGCEMLSVGWPGDISQLHLLVKSNIISLWETWS